MRFKKYVAKWNSALLEQVVSIYDGTHQTPTYTESGVKFVSVENIKDLYASNKYISYADFKENYKIVPQAGDILMTRIGDIGTPALVTTNEDLAYYVSLALLKVGKSITAKYLLQYIQTSFFKKELWEKTLHIAFPIKINKGDISLCKVQYPNISEQEEISHFLTLIDQRIDTQSKIIEELKTQKKWISQHYFMQRNSSSYGWEKTQLSAILRERKSFATKESEFPHVTLSKDGIYEKSDRFNRDFLVKSEDKKYKITYLNDLCYNPANLKFGVICLNTFGTAIFSPIYITFEVASRYNSYFIGYYLTNIDFINRIRKYEEGTIYERMAVGPDDFLKGEIFIPSLETQNKIVMAIQAIEQKIHNEITVLEKLKEQKKYLLSNMFI